jgi:hypothetical protein
MIRLTYLSAALLLAACGGATEDELFTPTGELTTEPTEPAPAAPAPASVTPESTTTTAARPRPVVEPTPAPAFRTCLEDADCLYRTSACLPLEPGGERFCREPLAELGAACEHDTDCEAGLHCWTTPGSRTRECLAGAGTRDPLACDRVGAEPVQDVGCELAE